MCRSPVAEVVMPDRETEGVSTVGILVVLYLEKVQLVFCLAVCTSIVSADVGYVVRRLEYR